MSYTIQSDTVDRSVNKLVRATLESDTRSILVFPLSISQGKVFGHEFNVRCAAVIGWACFMQDSTTKFYPRKFVFEQDLANLQNI